MNILLLGNGFDIYHKLPTKYHNFLNVVNYLICNEDVEFNTIGEVFIDKELQKEDPFVAECYKRHYTAYEKTVLDNKDIRKIILLCKNNFWFKYLLKSFNKDIGWIDFEREISFVLKCFKQFLDTCRTSFELYSFNDNGYGYIIKSFNFFFDELKRNDLLDGFYYEVKKEFTIEYPLGSGNVVVNKEKLIDHLVSEMADLARALQLYLKCFVESSFQLIKQESSYERCEAISNIDYTVTFNYTNTYEHLYLKNTATHMHGNLQDRIILGVNPDEMDELENIDTLLIPFKKYFQRVLLGTDDEFWSKLNEIKEEQHEILLIVMGHSLDITDKDIIVKLFEMSDEICILYHDEQARGSYISNLVKIFGKTEFDKIRQTQSLRFLPLDMDFTDFTEELSSKAFDKVNEDISRYL